jgi:hypothetical protein
MTPEEVVLTVIFKFSNFESLTERSFHAAYLPIAEEGLADNQLFHPAILIYATTVGCGGTCERCAHHSRINNSVTRRIKGVLEGLWVEEGKDFLRLERSENLALDAKALAECLQAPVLVRSLRRVRNEQTAIVDPTAVQARFRFQAHQQFTRCGEQLNFHVIRS